MDMIEKYVKELACLYDTDKIREILQRFKNEVKEDDFEVEEEKI